MMRMRNIGSWVCLLLWGGVHAMQLEHVVAHHLVGAAHAAHCSHHHEPLTVIPWDSELPVVDASEDCALCDWTGVPALASPMGVSNEEASPWFIRPVLGEVNSGWTDAFLWEGICRRGPPAADFS